MDRTKLRIVWVCLGIEALALVLQLTKILASVPVGLMIMAAGATSVGERRSTLPARSQA